MIFIYKTHVQSCWSMIFIDKTTKATLSMLVMIFIDI